MLDTRMLNQGMSQDNVPSMQPQNTYRYALNAVLETSVGDHGGLSNELGNSLRYYLGDDRHIVGSCVTDDNRIILFVYDDSAAHRIVEYIPSSNTLTNLIIDPCLNFQRDNYVQTSFHIEDCDTWIYFSDRTNPFRAVNISDISYYTQLVDGSPVVCDRLKYSKETPFPVITISTKSTSTNLENGLYYVSTRYVDKFGNTSDWSPISRPVSLGSSGVQYLSTATHSSYSGSHDLADVKCDKVITINLSEIQLKSYDYVQFAFIPRTTDSGALGEVLVSYPVQIATSLEYTFGGFPSEIEYTTSIDEILSSTLKPHIVNAHTILNNRLYISGNEVERDYGYYQKFASKIKVTWTSDIGDGLSSANPNADQQASFLDDEVYALGAIYEHTDGTLSPVFHIPGRPKNNVTGSNRWIGTNGVAVSGLWDSGTDDYGDAASFQDSQRWRQISTATDDGELGYYEVSTNYPNIITCSDNPDGYWGRDWAGNLLVGTPIRHHRMPSFDAFPFGRISIDFTNVELPQGVAKIHFVYSDRSFERTILDKGILIPQPVREVRASSITPKNYPTAIPPYGDNYLFLSSQQLLLDTFHTGEYVKLYHTLKDSSPATPSAFTETDSLVSKTYTVEMYDHLEQTFYPTSHILNTDVLDYVKLPKAELGLIPNAISFDSVEYKNNSINTSYGLFKLTLANESFVDEVPYVALKTRAEVYKNLASIRYHLLGSSNANMGGGNSGDAFASRVNVTDYEFDLSSNPWVIKAYHISYLSMESHVRYPLRAKSNEKKYKVFENDYSHATNSLARYVYSKAYPLDSVPTTGEYSIYPESYLYRKSYSFTDSINEYQGLPYSYDYCSSCDPKNSTRVYYSDYSDTDDAINSLTTIRPNNYVALPSPVKVLFNNFSELYALTVDSSWKIPTRTQELVSQDTTVYIGKADAIGKPLKLNPTSVHFSGGSYPSSVCSTEYGTVYMDDATGRPILLSRDLNDLSKTHLRSFFAENGSLKLLKQFPNFSSDQYVGETAIGYRISYDQRYKRVLITKKDFSAKFPNYTTYTNGNFYYLSTPVTLYDSTYFQNESYTISYSFLTNAWVSFHSYIPDYHFYSRLNHYTSIRSGLYLSSSGPYQQYYGIKHDFILDCVFPHIINKKATSINIRTNNSTNGSHSNSYFDRMIVYNSKQVSPLASLQYRAPLEYQSSYATPSFLDVDRLLKFNDFRDYSVNDLPIWIKSNSPSVDRELNPARVSSTKSLFELSRFSDNFTGVRLYSNSPDNVKLVNEFIALDSTNHNR